MPVPEGTVVWVGLSLGPGQAAERPRPGSLTIRVEGAVSENKPLPEGFEPSISIAGKPVDARPEFTRGKNWISFCFPALHPGTYTVVFRGEGVPRWKHTVNVEAGGEPKLTYMLLNTELGWRITLTRR
jgi:hypothetical protein